MDGSDETRDLADDPEATLPPPDLSGSAAELVRVLDRYLADLQAGNAPDRARLLEAHPDLAGRLEQCLAGIEFVHRAARAEDDGEGPARLGDFRIVREVGRGGMGVVYEAEQVSLGRMVALKVLRFGAVADAEAMDRFRREAETVARLHHTNIVPIFAVGEHRGVNYYAMQFIEGRSLADVAEEARRAARAIPAAEVARCGLQAAEALEHAHRRGVIHRDIKPSNLLLDPEGVTWLTDFGLAKRSDEVALTLTGALMGTPRYMSPEQAESSLRPVDHRTDIYSLGATLYELAAGRPPFEATSPLAVLEQILGTEPVPPRKHRPGLPRDLETIILKCLAKEPGRRYASARDLADDLRACLDGRSPRARRPNPAEQVARWARKNRRSLAVAGLTAAASVLAVAGAIAGFAAYREARLGGVVLTTDDPHATAEILDDGDESAVVPPFSLPTRQPLPLPEGAYRVRVSAPGEPGATARLLVDRGAARTYKVGVGEGRLWAPFEAKAGDLADVIDLGGRADVIHSDGKALRLLDGGSGRAVWELELRPEGPPAAGEDPWRRVNALRPSLDEPPGLVRPAPDLDGDGVGDLVWAGRMPGSLWAVSGKGDGGQGKELWQFPPGPARGGTSRTLGIPAAIDADGDGTLDLIATFADGTTRWVEAVAGRSGRSLWRSDLAGEWFPPGVGSSGDELPLAAEVVRVGGRPRAVVAAGSRLAVLEATTGAAVRVTDTGLRAILAARFGDLDGDGAPEALVLGERTAGAGLRLAAVAPDSGRVLWERPVAASFQPWAAKPARLDWPTIADLDGDGRAEVILPAMNHNGLRQWVGIEVLDGPTGRPRWLRHLRQNPEIIDKQVDRFVVGPDIDGDGARDLFAASIASGAGFREAALFVDALSGRDGRTLWWWRRPLARHIDGVGRMDWWPAGGDGWPQLLVPVIGWPEDAEALCLLSAGTGRLQGEVPGGFDPRVADLDGDGLHDLAYRSGKTMNPTFGAFTIHAARGTPPESWRRLGHWTPARDLDGDGTDDVVSVQDDRLTAASGRDGRVLWRSAVEPEGGRPWTLRDTGTAGITCPPPPMGDLDGDGTPDVLVVPNQQAGSGPDFNRVPVPLRAFSGRTGRHLWGAGDVAISGTTSPIYAKPMPPECRDLDGDGRPEVLVALEIDNHAAPPRRTVWLGVLSGRDGRWSWVRPLGDGPVTVPAHFRADRIRADADLDGDTVRDLVFCKALPVPGDPQGFALELHAWSGRDGRPLWNRPLTQTVNSYWAVHQIPAPAVGDLDGDGRPEVVIIDREYKVPRQGMGFSPAVARVLALEGRTGAPKWPAWEAPDEDGSLTDPSPTPLLADLDGDGRRSIVAAFHRQQGDEVVILDARGRVRQRRAFPGPSGSTARIALLAGDLDGARGDELAFTAMIDGRARVLATRGGVERDLWVWTPPSRPQIVTSYYPQGRPERRELREWSPALAPVAEIRRAGGGCGPTVVAGIPGEAVFGLDGATGKPAWRGRWPDDPNPGTSGPTGYASALLATGDPGGGPLVVGRLADSTCCRPSLPIPPGAGRPPGRPAPGGPRPGDPRLLRPLPWVQPLKIGGGPAVLMPPAVALVVLLVPGLLLRRSLRRRSLAAVGLTILFFGLDFALVRLVAGSLAPTDNRSLLVAAEAVGGLPFLAFLYASATWAIRGRRGRLALLMAGWLAVSLAGAALALRHDAADVAPGQIYSREGWYWIGFLGANLAGGVLLMQAALSLAFGLAFRVFRAISRPRPA